jgi:uncharacterized membrane protein
VNRFIDYCREMIDDRMEDGLSEEEAVAAMGSPEYVASQFLMDAPRKAPEQPVKSRELKTWQIVVLAITSPIWITLAFGAMIALFSLVISVAATLFGLYCAAGGLILGGVVALVVGLAAIPMPDLLFPLAAGAMLIGIGLLMILGLNFCFRQSIRLCKWLFTKIQSLFSKKESVK